MVATRFTVVTPPFPVADRVAPVSNGFSVKLVATADVPRGDILCREQPFTTMADRTNSVPNLVDWANAIIAARATNPTVLDLFNQLHPRLRADPTTERLARICFDRLDWATTTSEVKKAIQRVAKLVCNCFPASPDEEKQPRVAVFHLLSCANHSCLPNAAYQWDSAGAQGLFVARRALKAGDEVTISYIPAINSVHERRARLRAGWQFDCQCALCVAQTRVPPPATHAL